MALLPSIRIDLASSFDGKGFKKASRSANLLTKQFKSLGYSVAAALSARAIVNYSAAAVKAFAEEDAAVTKLTKTFDNLGMSFQGAVANDYIERLQRTVAVSDDQLRPALERLIRTTIDYDQAQKLLNVALDVSAGTGKDLESVTNALSKAYLGQTTTIARLNVGIGQAEAKSMSFDEILARLNDRFSGQAAAAVDTYAGKLKLLSIAGAEARESIGERMIMSLELLAKDKTIEGLTNDMQKFADKIGLASLGLADIFGKLNRKIEIGGRTLGEILFAAAGGGFIDALAKSGAIVEYGIKQRTLGAPGAMAQAQKDAVLRKKAIDDQKKLIAAQKKAAADQLKREKDTQALKRAGTVFDMENIQIVAAMQGKIDGEQRLRLTALLAINQGNADAAEKLSTAILAANSAALANLGVMMKAGDTIDDVVLKIINAQTKASLVALGIANIPKAKNPFEDWVDIIAKILAGISQINNALNGLNGGKAPTTPAPNAPVIPRFNGQDLVGGGTLGFNAILGVPFEPGNQGLYDPSVFTQGTLFPKSNMPDYVQNAGLYDPNPFKKVAAPVSVQVNVSGSVISEGDLANKIIDQLYAYQSSGNKVLYEQVQV